MPVHAHCPLCTAAVGAAAVTANYYGFDASVIGLMIGGFAITTGLWIGLRIKKQYLKFQLPLLVLLSFVLTVIPLQSAIGDNIAVSMLFFGEPGSLLNKVYFINKLFAGAVTGGIAVTAAYLMHVYVKNTRGHVLFPYQGIAFTLASLLIGWAMLPLILGV